MIRKHQVEFIIYGSTPLGEITEPMHGFADSMDVVSAYAKSYKKEFPRICHINVDIAFPMEGPNK